MEPKLADARVNKTFARKAQAVLDDVAGHGYIIRPTQVIRSKYEQRCLFAQGRKDSTLLKAGYKKAELLAIRRAGFTVDDSVVTKTLNSKHIDGLAMDVAFLDNEGDAIWSTAYEGWAIYGKACKAHNLTWGGTWKMKDLPHCELSGKSKT